MSADLLKILQNKYKTKVYSSDKVPPIERISTGIATLDAILGGGLPLGRIIELFGPESGGKTSISLAIARSFIEQGHSVLYQDMERHISQEDLTRNLLNVPEFIYSRPTFGEEAVDLAVLGAENGAKLIITDTVAMLEPKSVYEKTENDSEARSIGGAAGLINRLKSKITDHIEYNKAVLILINQIRDNLNSPHGGISTPGGHALKHMCSVRIRITHATKDQNVVGRIKSQIKTEKNKTYTPGLQCEIPIDNGLVQRTESLVLTAIDLGILNKKNGGWLSFNPDWQPVGKYESNLAQGTARLASTLEENEELYELIRASVQQRIEEELNVKELTDE